MGPGAREMGPKGPRGRGLKGWLLLAGLGLKGWLLLAGLEAGGVVVIAFGGRFPTVKSFSDFAGGFVGQKSTVLGSKKVPKPRFSNPGPNVHRNRSGKMLGDLLGGVLNDFGIMFL